MEKVRAKLEITLPIFFIIFFILTFLWSNSKIRFSEIGRDLHMYYSFLLLFLKYAIKCLIYLVVVDELLRKYGLQKIFVRLIIISSLLFFSLKSYNVKELSIIFVVLVLWILKPESINFSGLASFLGFVIGARMGHWEWFDKDAKLFLYIPFFILSFSSEKVWKEISIIVLSVSFLFVMRGLGIITGTFLIFFRFLNLIFKNVELISILFLSYIGFLSGYFWFLEFQGGVDPFTPFIFTRKLYIPFLIFAILLILRFFYRKFEILRY